MVNLVPIMVNTCFNVFKYRNIIILTIKSDGLGILSLLSKFRTYVYIAHKMQIHPFFLLNYKYFLARGRCVYGFNRVGTSKFLKLLIKKVPIFHRCLHYDLCDVQID